jgi:hypothetical protein
VNLGGSKWDVVLTGLCFGLGFAAGSAMLNGILGLIHK